MNTLRISALLTLALCMVLPAHARDKSEDKVIFGVHEQVYIQELGITLPAKMDTGAASVALSATNIKRIRRDGQSMVRFDLALKLSKKNREKLGISSDQLKGITLPLAGHVRIKKRPEDHEEDEKDYNRRPTVELTLCIGGRKANVTVNLTDRRRFNYPVLVGTKALRAMHAIIDPAQSMTMGEADCAPDAAEND